MIPQPSIARTPLTHTWLHVPYRGIAARDYTEYPTRDRAAFSAVLTIDNTPAGLILNTADDTPTTLVPFVEPKSTWDDFESFVDQCRTDRGARIDAASVLEGLIEQHLTEAFIRLAAGSGSIALRLLESRRTPTGDGHVYVTRLHQLIPTIAPDACPALSRFVFIVHPPAADQWWQRWNEHTRIWIDLTNPPRAHHR